MHGMKLVFAGVLSPDVMSTQKPTTFKRHPVHTCTIAEREISTDQGPRYDAVAVAQDSACCETTFAR